MTMYEVALIEYPNAEPPDNTWWTAVCFAMPGCVSDGPTREEALTMIADAMAVYLEPGPGWEVAILDEEQARIEKEATLTECRAEGGVTEIHWVEPQFMTEEAIHSNPHLEPAVSPIG